MPADAASQALPPGRADRTIPLIIACAFFMESLDSTIIATALPEIAEALGEDPLHLSLAITSYLLSLAVFIPLSGWLADRYGSARIFRNAIVVFVLGSVACAAAQSVGELVLARMLQGFGGAMMVPVGRLVMLRSVPKHALISAMALLTMPALIAPILGPLIGGLIATYTSWRWIFLINVPIGVLGWFLARRYIPDIRAATPEPLDLVGWGLLGTGIAGLMLGFESIGKHVLPNWIPVTALLAGAALLVLYVRHAHREPLPIIRLSLLRVQTFRIAAVGGSLFRTGLGSLTLLMPLMLQLGFGYSAARSGMIVFTGAIGALAMKTLAPAIARRFGFRRLLLLSGVICALMLASFGLYRVTTPTWILMTALLVHGFIRSLHFTCLNAMAFSDIDDPAMSQASSLMSTTQQLAITVGVGFSSQVLALSVALRGNGHVDVSDFTIAFAGAGLLSLFSVWAYARLPANAGEAVSGHDARTRQPTTVH